MKDKRLIYFEELPRNTQHALTTLMEWHSVIVYEIKKGMYGFYILDKYMPRGSDFTGLVESEYVSEHHLIQKSVLKIIETEFNGIRCRYFPKGCYLGIAEMEIFRLCEFKEGLGFSLELHSTDYGFLDKERAKISPAHVHILDKDGLEIGLLDISGSCPKKVSDIKEFRPPHIPGKIFVMKNTPLKEHRKNIVKWANREFSDDETNWEYMQDKWKRMRKEYR